MALNIVNLRHCSTNTLTTCLGDAT